MTHKTIALVDVSYAFALRWHRPATAEVNDAARDTLLALNRVRNQVDHVICCLDAPPYLRATSYPEYKGTRDPESEQMRAQKRTLRAALRREGYQMARAEGYEADDIIATLALALYPLCEDVRIVGRDKDLYQCVNSRVRIFEPAVGERPETLMGPDEVRAKTGVEPAQIADWLALQGDKSDNVPGCPGCGPKHATRLVSEYGALDKLFDEMQLFPDESASFVGKALWAKLKEHTEQVRKARELVTLDTAAPIDVGALLQKKDPEPVDSTIGPDAYRAIPDKAAELMVPPADERDTDIAELIADRRAPPSAPRASEPPPNPEPEAHQGQLDAPRAQTEQTTAIVRAPESEYTRRLEPQTMQQAVWLAEQMQKSGMFPKLRRHQEHLMVMLAGRSLGLDSVQSLMTFHVLDGVPVPKWTLVQGMVQRHPDCEYFMMVDSTEDAATYETKRRQNPVPQRLTYTLGQALQAGRVRPGGGWVKDSAAMCRKTAAVHLGRAVFPDLPIFGFYSDVELD